MPTYEYVCDKGHKFEEFQSIVADPITVCPVCGAHAERHISGGTGLIFKGSGFYITDYGRKGNSASSPAAAPHSSSHSDHSESHSTPSHSDHSESKSESPPAAPATASESSKDSKSKPDKSA